MRWGTFGSYIKGEDTAVIKACVEVGPGPGLVNGTWGAIADSDGDGEGRLCPGRPGDRGTKAQWWSSQVGDWRCCCW